MTDLTRRVRAVWGRGGSSALSRAIARHPATHAKNALQEAVELEYGTENAVPCTVVDLDEYRARR